MNKASRPIVIWRFSDQKPGHDAQSIGLVAALKTLADCRVFEFASADLTGWFDYIPGRFPAGRDKDRPHLIIGAGHGTHLSMLCARRAYGGKIIVLMRPTLPSTLFDLCMIPEHDGVLDGDNIFMTRGVLNNILPSAAGKSEYGLMLIGGPSKHFRWNEPALLNQIRTVTAISGRSWHITDSARTPADTRRALADLAGGTIEYFSCSATPPGWVGAQLAGTDQVWVTCDSISMIYEALSSGARVGVFDIPARRQDRLVRSIERLVSDRMVTSFAEWHVTGTMHRSSVVLQEAGRAARHILDRFCSA